MNRRILYFSLLTLSISACSGVDNNRAIGDFDYAVAPEAKPLIIPQGLNKPTQHKNFQVSDKINHKGPIGKMVDVRAPSLVLPVAASSRVVADSEEAIVWFDKVLENKDLLAFIQNAVQEQVSSMNVALNKVDGHANTYKSDWFHNEVESGWLFKSIDSAESMRFRYQLAVKPHGRSVSLQVFLADYMKTDQQGSGKDINPIDQQRAEMAMLNHIIEQVDYMYRVEAKEIRLKRANQKLVSLGENLNAEPAYLLAMKADDLWSNLPVFFEKHGFLITDLNETKKIYYVDFKKPDIGIWGSLWGDDASVLDIADSKYQFVLSDKVEQTALTIKDKEGNALSAETLKRLIKVMESGLSFKNTF